MIIEDNFSYFSLKLYVVIPHLNHLIEMAQMRDHYICFNGELTKIIPNYHQILLLIKSSDHGLHTYPGAAGSIPVPYSFKTGLKPRYLFLHDRSVGQALNSLQFLYRR